MIKTEDKQQTHVDASDRRIAYIDALKGFAILCVIYGHVFHYADLESAPKIDVIYKNFYLCLFFLISGYFTRILPKRPIQQLIVEKIKYILVPTIAWGLLYIYTFSLPLKELLLGYLGQFKAGYWFTWTLFAIFIIVAPLQYYCKKTQNTLRGAKLLLLALTISIGLSYSWSIFVDRISNGFIVMILDIIDFRMVFKYLPYFLTGMIMGVNREATNRLLGNRYFIASILFIYLFYLTTPRIHSSYGWLVLILQGFSGSLLMMAIGNWLDRREKLCGRLAHSLIKVGRYSLIIYLMHFFFIQTISKLIMIMPINILKINVAMSVAVAVVISIIISYLCICVAKLLRKAPAIYKILCGRVID